MGKAIGIDLGTTNSVACYFDGNRAQVLLNANNQELTPSVVSDHRFDEKPEIVIGQVAVNGAELYPEDTIYSIKRLMGQQFDNEKVQKQKALVNYRIVESDEPKGRANVMMGGRQYAPEEISAFILAEIKSYSETVSGEEVTHAVITVPAYFGEPQFEATRQAGEKAGLVVKKLLPEPTAAAIAFGASTKLSGNNVLVFDLGGGTFDISILSIVGDNYDVKVVSGDRFLGGDDFDNVIVQMILEGVQKEYGVDISGDRRFRIIAKRLAEEAKLSFSSPSTQAATILKQEAARVNGKVIDLRLRITREEFERRIAPLVDNCMRLVRAAMQSEGYSPETISDVLLVGGSTRVPLVRRSLEELFGKEKIRQEVNPMQCVAIGAGILAQRMRGIECPNPDCKHLCDESAAICPQCGASLAVARPVLQGMDLADITTLNFGIEVVSGSEKKKLKILVEKGTPVPMLEPKVEILYTTEDKQRVIRVPVHQTTGTAFNRSTEIGTIEFGLPMGLPINHPVKVEFRLDRNAVVTLGVEVDSQRHEERLTRRYSEPTKEEIPTDEEETSERDRDLALLESFAAYTRDFLQEFNDILINTEKHRLTEGLKSAEALLNSPESGAIGAKIRELNTLLNRCGTASVIAQARSASLSSTDEGVASDLRAGAERLKRLAEDREHGEVQKLSDSLAPLIRQVHESGRDLNRIYSAKNNRGLLRDRSEASI
jgi:molecular chaperone DnaK